ncbi:MAG: hypothetical protein NVSMB62_17580 [Acidobacteriaceae bacterium]
MHAQTSSSGVPARTPDAQVEANVLKALASASDLGSQAITTTTVYGVVTLSGSVQTEAQRTEAETIASRTLGVLKVVDELTLTSETADMQTQPGSQLPGSAQPGQGISTSAPSASGERPPHDGPPQSNHPQADQGYGPPPPQPRYPHENRSASAADYGGQLAGEVVTISTGALVRIRINETLDSGRTKPGTTFDGIVVNDVVAGGAVAIPRGAAVQGTVLDATKSGTLAGRGEMSLQLTHVTLGGKVYPIKSDVWAHHGGDKTIQTVNSTAAGSGVGAILGAVAGGGAGAAIGAGVGGALGLGASAASGAGQVYIPSEGMLTFHLAEPATVATVSQQEMNRLAQGAGPAATPPQQMRRRYYPYPASYPGPYYGPVDYHPRYYYPYPY